MPEVKPCREPGCMRPATRQGFCQPDYRRARRRGLPLLQSLPMESRFWTKVDRGSTDACWTWTAALRPSGYGAFYCGDRMVGAHRISYLLAKGPIPEGLVLDHLCRNRACVNPHHLEAVTPRTNTQRGLSGALVMECRHGHPYTPENTYRNPTTGQRKCRACKREKRLRDTAA